MENTYVFFCEDSLEGIFTGVYVAWEKKVGHGNVELRTENDGDTEFFCEYHYVKPESSLAAKVWNTMRKRLGGEITENICYAAAANDKEKGTAIYRTLVECLSRYGSLYGKKYLENLKNPYVRKVMELYRKVRNEYHHYLGFLRFSQISGGILFAACSPENDLLLLFQEHFADRFQGEYWIIYDERRGKSLLHAPHHPCVLYRDHGEKWKVLMEAEDTERDYEELFRGFCRHISIRERENRNLQQMNLPIKYRKYMVEFDENLKKNLNE